MKKPPRTPNQISKELKSKPRKAYSFSLYQPNVERMVELANSSGLAASVLMDEAIEFYLSQIETTKRKPNQT